MSRPVGIIELRVLDGPNLFFPRPAIKLTLAAPAWLEMSEERFARALERAGSSGRAGRPWSEQRRRAVGRRASSIARRCLLYT
jgi:cyanophycin synthetase